ncbi:MAG: hypothetical protein QRY74_03430 [Chlamydia sp.]
MEKELALGTDLFQEALPYIDGTLSIEKLPKAKNGYSRVYYGSSIVFKKCENKRGYNRLKKMYEASRLCTLYNYTHLTIPKAFLHEDFIIEEFLPIGSQRVKEQIGLYIENYRLFDSAIREFTDLLCQSTFYDFIYDDHKNPYISVPGCKTLPRYDNIPLYIENGVGKIGLIDLEDFYSKPDTKNRLYNIDTTLAIFPCHFDLIIETAKRYIPNINREFKKEDLLSSFQTIYKDHKEYIEKKYLQERNISLESLLQSPEKFVSIECSEIRKKMLLKEIGKKSSEQRTCRELHEFYKDVGGIEGAVESILPSVIGEIEDFMRNSLYRNRQFYLQGIASYNQLLEVMTIRVEKSNRQGYKKIRGGIGKSLEAILNRPVPSSIPTIILETVLTEFANGGEVAYCNVSNVDYFYIFC